MDRPPSSLQRELAHLHAAGILESRREANHTYYRPNVDCPILPELTGLIVKTVGVVDVLRRAFKLFARRIDWAFIYGSLARGDAVAESDIDLLIIGDVTLSDLARPLKTLERKLGRPINPSIFPRREFAAKLRAGHYFVRSLVPNDKVFLLGDPREFAAAFAGQAASSPPHKPQRAG